jgi:hypothetical protein
MEFVPFDKIPRLTRECTVTEKIDGTNASILITEDGQFLTGSRTRWIAPEDDNFGFSKWAHQNREELMALGVGHHFGEWWGSGIQRGYGLPKGIKRFSLFNTKRWARHGFPLKVYPTANPQVTSSQLYPPACCDVVPVVYEGLFDTAMIDALIDTMRERGSFAELGFMNPEGIIIWHHAAGQYFKKTLEKDSEWKGKR